jgi:hypothetical protein
MGVLIISEPTSKFKYCGWIIKKKNGIIFSFNGLANYLFLSFESAQKTLETISEEHRKDLSIEYIEIFGYTIKI